MSLACDFGLFSRSWTLILSMTHSPKGKFGHSSILTHGSMNVRLVLARSGGHETRLKTEYFKEAGRIFPTPCCLQKFK